jgi:tRNA nucleotidyltransferase (CCA-adding enzyme)
MMKKLLSEVIVSIRPEREYEREILEKANSIIYNINRNLKHAKAILGGSGAKGTWLKTFDADIFVKFNYGKFKDKSSEISDMLDEFLRRDFRIKRLHGSRDYFQIKQGKFTFEIVPILDIKRAEMAKNITDVSPLHAGFVTRHKHLKDEMRLTKQFFKSAGVYGAESYIRGFSGYVCELLTIHYGSFLRLIKAATKWKEKTVVDIKNHYKKKDVFNEINKSKLGSPLIIIDPVQKDRNAAAALSEDKFHLLAERAKKFLKAPSKSFFEIKELKRQDIFKRAGKRKFVMLEVTPLDKKEDVAGAKMLKAFSHIERILIQNGFKIIEGNMVWDMGKNCIFYFILDEDNLPKKVEVVGPPLKIRMHVSFFKKKHNKTFVKGGRIFAFVKRKFTKADELIKITIKDSVVGDNVKKVKIL